MIKTDFLLEIMGVLGKSLTNMEEILLIGKFDKKKLRFFKKNIF